MNKWIVILIAVVLVVAAIVVLVFYWTSPLTDAADRFFVSIREGRATGSVSVDDAGVPGGHVGAKLHGFPENLHDRRL